MAFCEQCGNKISDTAKFCGKCGTPVSSGQTEAQAEIPQTGVSTACAQCGAPLEAGEMFCANCGAKVGAAAQYQPAQIQTQHQDVGDGVLKKGIFVMTKSTNGKPLAGFAGSLLLYRDRMEYYGKPSIVIPILKISAIELIIDNYGSGFKITLDGKEKYDFRFIGENDEEELSKEEEKIWKLQSQQEVESWIDSVRIQYARAERIL
jgi:uncharacterized Zn finger protein (UPF0148 family)